MPDTCDIVNGDDVVLFSARVRSPSLVEQSTSEVVTPTTFVALTFPGTEVVGFPPISTSRISLL